MDCTYYVLQANHHVNAAGVASTKGEVAVYLEVGVAEVVLNVKK